MSIIVVQLSDTHVQAKSDPIFAKAEKIADAIAAEIDSTVTGCVIINAGDSSYHGTKTEYDLAYELFSGVQAGARQRIGGRVPVELLVIPGNHDNDLSGDQAARDGLLPAVKESVPAASILDLLLAPQGEYFAYAAKLVGEAQSLTKSRPFLPLGRFNFWPSARAGPPPELGMDVRHQGEEG